MTETEALENARNAIRRLESELALLRSESKRLKEIYDQNTKDADERDEGLERAVKTLDRIVRRICYC